jgi:hypothetical protein
VVQNFSGVIVAQSEDLNVGCSSIAGVGVLDAFPDLSGAADVGVLESAFSNSPMQVVQNVAGVIVAQSEDLNVGCSSTAGVSVLDAFSDLSGAAAVGVLENAFSNSPIRVVQNVSGVPSPQDPGGFSPQAVPVCLADASEIAPGVCERLDRSIVAEPVPQHEAEVTSRSTHLAADCLAFKAGDASNEKVVECFRLLMANAEDDRSRLCKNIFGRTGLSGRDKVMLAREVDQHCFTELLRISLELPIDPMSYRPLFPEWSRRRLFLCAELFQKLGRDCNLPGIVSKLVQACLEDWSPGSFRDFLQDGADYGPTLFDMLPPHSDSWWLAS